MYIKTDFNNGLKIKKGDERMEEFYLLSNGFGRIHCGMWQPSGQPKAVVQLIHGIAEHIARYDHFAKFLAAHGYLVVAQDHMGHGGSIEDLQQGYFYGGWMAAVADVKSLHDKTAEEYPTIPYYMLGHSMGSFLLRTYLYTYPDSVDKAIISGTAWQSPGTLKAGLFLCKAEEKRLGDKASSPIMNKLMFGAYNKPFAPNRTTHDWITSVDAVVDAYIEDPLCGFDATIALARDMLLGISMNQMQENLQKMKKNLPVLFVSGSKDPVGAMAKGVLACIDAFKRAGMKDITIKLYPEGRHEMLNEINREEVYQDILDWIQK